MQFTLVWIEFFLKEKLFGFGVGEVEKYDKFSRNLFSIYRHSGGLQIDLLWFRVYEE